MQEGGRQTKNTKVNIPKVKMSNERTERGIDMAPAGRESSREPVDRTSHTISGNFNASSREFFVIMFVIKLHDRNI